MSIPLFLAMTGQEIHQNPSLPEKIAWMSCHFSAGDAGISHIPDNMPRNSMLILDDRIPYQGHNSAMVCAHLLDTVNRHRCSHVLLDFERPPTAATLPLVRQICETMPCPVGIPIDYANDLDCPIFVPPVPPHLTLHAYLTPWKNREIWLEVALDGSLATITDKGCQFTPVPYPMPEEPMHHCTELCCHYHTAVSPEQIQFSYFRTSEDLIDLQNHAAKYGVTLSIGLYQELGK